MATKNSDDCELLEVVKVKVQGGYWIRNVTNVTFRGYSDWTLYTRLAGSIVVHSRCILYSENNKMLYYADRDIKHMFEGVGINSQSLSLNGVLLNIVNNTMCEIKKKRRSHGPNTYILHKQSSVIMPNEWRMEISKPNPQIDGVVITEDGRLSFNTRDKDIKKMPQQCNHVRGYTIGSIIIPTHADESPVIKWFIKSQDFPCSMCKTIKMIAKSNPRVNVKLALAESELLMNM